MNPRKFQNSNSAVKYALITLITLITLAIGARRGAALRGVDTIEKLDSQLKNLKYESIT